MVYQRELLKGNTDALLLAMVMEGPIYGYHLTKEIERRSSGYFQFKEGTLYPALHRLERSGLLTGEWAMSPAGQQRRYYSITEKGLRELRRKNLEWDQFSRAINLVMNPSDG